jgi:hypothetical protein
VTKQSGLWEEAVPRWGAGCAFVDYDQDGHVDLFVSNYIRFDLCSTLLARTELNMQLEGHSGPQGSPKSGQ